MTDNEIKMALEWHLNDEIHCSPCPYEEYSVTHYCVEKLISDALDLINRQQAEIERLEAEYEEVYKQAEADILGNLPQGGASCHWCIDKHKKYAIKEFAERLKENCKVIGAPLITNRIDNLVKEMVGDAK